MKLRQLVLTLTAISLIPVVAIGNDSESQLAKQILAETGVQGGLIVHLGCGDGKLTAALQASDSYLVHGLDRDGANVELARDYVRSQGRYGKVFVEEWTGSQLPYINNCINLVVSDGQSSVSTAEMMRALVPHGVAYVKSGETWSKIVKPRPDEIDEWTHYLHDPSNNAVAHDSVIEPPRHYQWQGSPRYSRQHDHMSSVSAVVSSNGRLFYVFDEAPRASILLPPQWHLIGRDAFNGTVLWKRTIETWHPHLWRLKSGPQSLARRLVAVGDRVFVTLGIDAPLSELDAATGRTVRTFDGTKATEEILCSDGTLLLSVAGEGQPLRSDPSKRYSSLAEMNEDVTNPLWTTAPRTIMALDVESGTRRWQKETPMVSMSLGADGQCVVFHDGERLQCISQETGEQRWTSDPLPVKANMRSSGGATVVLFDDVVLFSGQIGTNGRPQNRITTMTAVSLDNGKTLWQSEHHPCGHMGTPDDILIAGGLVWNGAVAQGSDTGTMTGRDLHSGEVESEFSPNVETHWFHHRCYRAKATDKYLLFSRTGIEFIDHAAEDWICHHWVRGACNYGIMPCNGLIYAPQHPCACYIEAKLYGFTALAPPSSASPIRREVPEKERLVRGPAFGTVVTPADAPADDWPTFRHDAKRSGAVKTSVEPTGLKCTWSTKIGGRLSSSVLADGILYVTSIDNHQIHALNALTGQAIWDFTAAGRVDSPPTIWKGRALFGSADGHIYCLNAHDGKLVWRYRAAPEDRRMMAFEQVESVWPVHGSVLIQDDVLYSVAGRSMFLDGGLRLLRLDPQTGTKLSETILDDKDPETAENLQVHIQGLNMPVALPDILSSEGKYVYMRSLPFTLEGKRKFVTYVPVKEQQGDDLHLFCPTGYLDDSLWHRTYWGYGRAWASGAGGYHQAGRLIPAGRPLVFDEDTVFGFGRLWKYYRWTTPLEFRLFAANKQPELETAGTERKPIKKAGKRTGSRTIPVTRFVSDWSNDMAVQVNSMVLTDGALFAAGPPDLEDEEESVTTLLDPETQEKLAKQSEAFQGKQGALLVAVSRKSGKKLAAYQLGCVPRFDGLIAANGRLFLSTLEGAVYCLSSEEGRPLPAAEQLSVTARE